MPMVLSDTMNNGQAITMPAGWMGVFGSGQYKAFMVPGTHSFTVPDSISRIRVRVVGAGGSGAEGNSSGFTGGSSSFGVLLSATGGEGGKAGSNQVSIGGTGAGGNYQASGGSSLSNGSTFARPFTTINNGGGAAAGSQLGNGGNSYGKGGAAVGNNHSTSASDWGASAYGMNTSRDPGPDCMGLVTARSEYDRPVYPVERFPFDFFSGGGSCVLSTGNANVFSYAGSGAGGAYNQNSSATKGGHGGGGGGSYYSSAGSGGCGGGGGKMNIHSADGTGGAGGGYAHGVFDVSSGDSFAVTVGLGGRRSSNDFIGTGGHGLVVVEW